MKKVLIVVALLSSCALVACGESGPTDEEIKKAENARKTATKLTKDAESAAAVATNCRSDMGALIRSLRNVGSRLTVGLSFADYSSQVGQARQGLLALEGLAIDAQEKADKQEKKVEEAEAVLEPENAS